ncbi:MAG TPA: 2-hydroxyacid dehydrogenase [Steroidobacteraceae bacterium]|nr:2-hydroxyacid dehydrogenase [Steroidobacteraceae bacterium]
MAEPLVVLLYSSRFVSDEALALLGELVPLGFRWLPVEQGAGREARVAAFAAADYMFGYLGDPTTDELDTARHLRLFQLLSAGYDWLDVEAFRSRGIPLANNEGSNAVSTAEHAVLLMLALLKQLPQHHAATVRGEWLAMAHAMQMYELRGKVVGLVGFGNIARQVASRVHAFDAVVRYSKPKRASSELEQPSGAQHRSLDELLSESDIISLHVPLTPATRGMIDARAIARMRRGSWLINTARGALVDETALVEALVDGHLSGAGLDVFAHEPLDPGSPLLRLPNVVLTPHVAGSTRDTWRHRMATAWANVRRIEAGEEPASRIV